MHVRTFNLSIYLEILVSVIQRAYSCIAMASRTSTTLRHSEIGWKLSTDFRISENPKIRNCENPQIGIPQIRDSGNHDIGMLWTPGFPFIRRSENLYFRISENLIPGSPGLRRSGISEIRNLGNPEVHSYIATAGSFDVFMDTS